MYTVDKIIPYDNLTLQAGRNYYFLYLIDQNTDWGLELLICYCAQEITTDTWGIHVHVS